MSVPHRGRRGWRALFHWTSGGTGARIVVALVAPVLVGVSIKDVDQGLLVLSGIYLLTWLGTFWAHGAPR